MFKTLINAWKVKDIRSKILFTILLFVVYRIGCFIPVPGVNVEYISGVVNEYSAAGLLNLFSGGSFSSFSIFAMGVSPYITASIIVQLLTVAIPALERLSKEEDGRKKIENITRYSGIALGAIQCIGIIASMGAEAVDSTAWWNYARITIICTAGTAFLIWLGERITEKGVGNGMSMLIFASIVSQVPTVVWTLVSEIYWAIAGGMNTMPMWHPLVAVVVVVVMIVAIVAVDKAERKIPVQYAKRVVGRKLYGGQSTHIPIKANANGVMPLIFAITIIQIPAMIGQFWPNSGFNTFWTKWFTASGWSGTGDNFFIWGGIIYYVLYSLLILGFAYFYTTITFNPVEISKNLQQNGGFIPGIRPGKPTGDYLGRISKRLTLFGALFLMVIASIPAIVLSASGITIFSSFGTTSVLIMVSVALETMNQLESMMLMRHYKGFLG